MSKAIILYNNKSECCGCGACYSICPKDAIAMIDDEEGFSYPEIEQGKCIECRKCISVCPLKDEGDR